MPRLQRQWSGQGLDLLPECGLQVRPKIENLVKIHLASSLLVSEMKALRPSAEAAAETEL